MGNDLENQVNSIVRFISELYKPEDVWVKDYDDPDRYSIIFYFDKIDEKYILNRQAGDIRAHKENILTREIRTYIENYLGIKTQGLQPPDFFAPAESFPISIYVRHTT